MQRPKRIFVVADFKDESPRSIFLDERRMLKGLIKAGYDVHRFSYRNVLTQFNPFSGKHFRRFMPKFVKKYANQIMAEQVKYYYPDIVLFLTMKYMTSNTISAARNAAPNAVFVGRDGDPYPETKLERIKVGKMMDIIIMPSAGQFLQVYKDAGVAKCAFIPFTSDPDIHFKYEVEDKWKTNIVFLGAAKHSKIDYDADRFKITERLSNMQNSKVYACFGRPKTKGIDCFKAISGAKIGVSLNIVNDVYLYHSDRFINIPACGTFMLAKRIPGCELLFKDGVHVKYFDTEDEFFELADWYLEHDDEREKIAAAGMEYAHKEFNCTRIAKLLVDLIVKGSYDAVWKVIL